VATKEKQNLLSAPQGMNRSSRTNVLFIGNPGVGKSTLFNALLGNAEFHAGVSLDGGGVTKFLQEYNSGGITYMDTPGLNDIEDRKKCAQEITKALKRSGLYYICFIITTEEGRLRPDDKVAVRLVLDSAPEIGGQYSILVNKLPDTVYDHWTSHPDVFPSIFFRDFPPNLITTSIYYIKRDNALDGDDRLFDPNVLAGFQNFLRQAPSINIHPDKVQDIKSDKWLSLEKEYAKTIDYLKHTMESNQSEFVRIVREEQLRRRKAERDYRRKQHEIEAQYREETQNMQAQIMALAKRPPHCCFPSSALVRLKDGSHCPVASLEEGTLIQSVDHDGLLTLSEVYFVDGSPGPTPMHVLYYMDHANTEVAFAATGEHLIYASKADAADSTVAVVLRAPPVTAKTVQVGDWIYVRVQDEALLRPHRVCRVEMGLAEGRWSVLTQDHRLLVDGVLVSAHEINETWGILDTAVMRALYSIVPSFVTSPYNKWFCKQYDLLFESIAKSCRDFFSSFQ